MDTLTARTRSRYAKAVEALKKALAFEPLPDHAERDATLLRFELAAELAPKLLRRVVSERGTDAPLPKDAVRTALAARIIDETVATALLAAIDDRNRMVHDYSETFADELYERIEKSYQLAFESVLAGVDGA